MLLGGVRRRFLQGRPATLCSNFPRQAHVNGFTSAASIRLFWDCTRHARLGCQRKGWDSNSNSSHSDTGFPQA